MTEARIVVYTAIFDNFDVLLTPRCSPASIDYVCFTNTPEAVPEGWSTRQVDLEEKPARYANRSYKIRPHEFFAEYEYSVYMDGNFQPVGDLSELIEENLENVDLAVPPHPKRNCVYDEAAACKELGLGDAATIDEQMARYRAAGFPEKYGLSNTHIILRRHNVPAVKEAMDTWWEEYQCSAERDQLSFEFSLWSTNIDYGHFEVDYFEDGGYIYHYPHKPPGLAGDLWANILREKRQTPASSKLYTMGLWVLYYLLRAGGIFRRDGPGRLIEATREFVLE